MKLGKYSGALWSTKGATAGDKAKPKKPTKSGALRGCKNTNRRKDERVLEATAELAKVWR